jgi:hypothetical protein
MRSGDGVIGCWADWVMGSGRQPPRGSSPPRRHDVVSLTPHYPNTPVLYSRHARQEPRRVRAERSSRRHAAPSRIRRRNQCSSSHRSRWLMVAPGRRTARPGASRSLRGLERGFADALAYPQALAPPLAGDASRGAAARARAGARQRWSRPYRARLGRWPGAAADRLCLVRPGSARS